MKVSKNYPFFMKKTVSTVESALLSDVSNWTVFGFFIQ